MAQVTVAQVRRMAKEYGCGFEKGSGYYYFTGKNFRDSAVYVYRVYELSLEQWETELRNMIDRI